MKKFLKFSLLTVFLVSSFSYNGHAKNKAYIYQSNVNWVKLVKLSKKQMAGQTLDHPAEFSNSAIEDMLLSITLNQASLFKKEVKEKEVFNSIEARKYAPFIAEALNKAGPNEVVNVSIVHKRPYFILQNDYITNINIYKTSQGLHFYFNKLYAKIVGDYKQASQMTESIQKARSLNVSLQATPGQKLAMNNGIELIMDTQHSFADNVAAFQEKNQQNNEENLKAKSRRKATPEKENVSSAAPTNTASEDSSLKARLQKLEDLKKDKLVTEAEYQQKRKEILQDL